MEKFLRAIKRTTRKQIEKGKGTKRGDKIFEMKGWGWRGKKKKINRKGTEKKKEREIGGIDCNAGQRGKKGASIKQQKDRATAAQRVQQCRDVQEEGRKGNAGSTLRRQNNR